MQMNRTIAIFISRQCICRHVLFCKINVRPRSCWSYLQNDAPAFKRQSQYQIILHSDQNGIAWIQKLEYHCRLACIQLRSEIKSLGTQKVTIQLINQRKRHNRNTITGNNVDFSTAYPGCSRLRLQSSQAWKTVLTLTRS